MDKKEKSTLEGFSFLFSPLKQKNVYLHTFS